MARGRNTGAITGILAAVSVVALAAILAITQLRSPEPEGEPPPESTTSTIGVPPTTALPATTTTTDGSLQERGQPFSWAGTLDIDDQLALTLVEHEDSVFLFTRTPSLTPEFTGPTGLKTWRSVDGTDWQLVSEIGNEFEVFEVLSTRFGLISAGFNPETGDGLVWRSVDGTGWTETVVSTGAGPPFAGTILGAVANDEMVYVSVNRYETTDWRRIHRALSDRIGGPINRHGYTSSEDGRTIETVVAFGPLGVWLGKYPPEELGLTLEDLEFSWETVSNTAWVSYDGENWSEEPATPASYLFVGTDGRVHAHIQDPESPNSRVVGALDPDTLTWERVGPAPREELADRWEGGYIGWTDQGSVGRVSVSANGISWRGLDLRLMLPRDLLWSYAAIDGGNRGIASVATTFQTVNVEFAPVEWEQDGYRILATANLFDVTRDGSVVLRVPRWIRHGEAPNARWDPVAGTYEFFNRETGETLVTVDIAEVTGLLPRNDEIPEWARPGRVASHVFLFSYAETWPTPGTIQWNESLDVWTIQDITSIVTSPASHMLVTGTHVILVTSDEPGISVFTATTPGG